MDEEFLSRRAFFVSSGTLLFGTLTVLPLVTSCSNDSNPTAPKNSSSGGTFEINLDETANQILNNAGAALKFNVPGKTLPVIVMRISSTEVRALSSQCTHQGCEVGLPANDRITCPCHGSQYNLNGGVIQGPAPAPLTSFPAKLEGNKIILTV